MFRFNNLLAFLSLTSSALSLPYERPSVIGAKLEGSCTDLHLPTEDDYIKGCKHFCEKYRPTHIEERDPLDATYNLTAYNGKVIQWIYKIQDVYVHKNWAGYDDWWDTLPYNPDKCVTYFDKIISNPESGGLGKSYCVVDKTGGDWFGPESCDKKCLSGEGTVLVMGGMEEPSMTKAEKGPYGYGYLRYLTRKKYGTD